MSKKHWLTVVSMAAGVAAGVLLPVSATYAQEGAPAEVGSSDWQYQAITDFAARGLLSGYKDAKNLENRKLTRFEMATLIKRVVDSLLELPDSGADKDATPKPGTAATRGFGLDPIPTGKPPVSEKVRAQAAVWTEADLGTLKRLTDTYSVELAVIGVNLQEATDKIATLEGRVETLEERLSDPEGPLQTVINNVASLNKVRFVGFIQARYESFEDTREATGTPSASRPQVVDRFTLRRMRITLNARPTQSTFIKWEIEGGGAQLESRDAFLTYYLKGSPEKGYAATIGQFKVPFGFEIIQSSSVRELPERARIIRHFFPSERDRGFKISSATSGRYFYELAVMNDVIGPGRTGINTNDNNNDKGISGRLRTSTLGGRLDAGVSFSHSSQSRTALALGEPARPGGAPSASDPYDNNKYVWGADFQWFALDNTVLRGEGVWGKANGSHAKGYIITLVQNLSPKWQFVSRYDWFGADGRVLAPVGAGGTPIGDGVAYEGVLTNMAVGFIHHLDPSTRLKLFYELHERGRERLTGYGTGGSADRVPWQGSVLRFEVITVF